jgi:hypothetical protein
VVRQIIGKEGLLYELKNIRTNNHCVAMEAIVMKAENPKKTVEEYKKGQFIVVHNDKPGTSAPAYPVYVHICDKLELSGKTAYKVEWGSAAHKTYGYVNSTDVIRTGNELQICLSTLRYS